MDLLTPLFADAEVAADLSDVRLPAGHAGLRGGARPGPGRSGRRAGELRGADPRRRPRRALRRRGRGRRSGGGRQPRHPPDRPAHAARGGGRPGGGPLRALGRHQPGRRSTPASCCSCARPCRACCATSAARRPRRRRTPSAMPARPWPAAPGCSRRRPRRSGSRPPAGSTRCARTHDRLASALRGGAGAPVRRRGRHAGRAGRGRARGGRGAGRALGLRVPDLPWHAQRDRLAHLAGALGIAAGTLGKIARDLALLAQTEVGEACERPEAGRGGSSSMPHKRNPVAASVALAAAARAPGLVATVLGAMPQEHERGLGGWQAEWETLPRARAGRRGRRALGGRCAGDAGGRRGAHARQPRPHARAGHGRGGVDGAGRARRPRRGPGAGRGRLPPRRAKSRDRWRPCWPRTRR